MRLEHSNSKRGSKFYGIINTDKNNKNGEKLKEFKKKLDEYEYTGFYLDNDNATFKNVEDCLSLIHKCSKYYSKIIIYVSGKLTKSNDNTYFLNCIDSEESKIDETSFNLLHLAVFLKKQFLSKCKKGHFKSNFVILFDSKQFESFFKE